MARDRREYLRKWRESAFERGVCVRCGKDNPHNSKTCPDCKELYRVTRNPARRKRYEEQGRCAKCGRTLDEFIDKGRKHCLVCAENAKEALLWR